jgi:hypothetical protein
MHSNGLIYGEPSIEAVFFAMFSRWIQLSQVHRGKWPRNLKPKQIDARPVLQSKTPV